MGNIKKEKLDIGNCLFLGAIILATFTAVPAYVYFNGISALQITLFVLFFILTGMSITLGYHRLFSHRAFKAKWPVKLGTLIFGAAAFENAALLWASDHRRHHKFTDDNGDPYNAKEGFLHSHIGWILLKDPSQFKLDYVNDLRQDKLVMWQYKHYLSIAILAGLVLPGLIGLAFGGWIEAMGAILIAGVARIFFVHQFTFFINSLCHMIGRQPYSDACTARDSALMAFFTFGEGYHNFHHAFQHDYRNGVRAWQFDPTKWTIWLLNKAGLASQLRRVPQERIWQRQAAEQQRLLTERLQEKKIVLSESLQAQLHSAHQRLETAFKNWERLEVEYRQALEKNLIASKTKLTELNREFQDAKRHFYEAIQEWREKHQIIATQFA